MGRRQTLVSRWRELERANREYWELRARRAAAFLGPKGAVVDLGRCLMTLEQFLSPGTRYIPVDVFGRDARTVVVDLNRQPRPALGADALFGLGLLECIYDVPGLLAQIAAACSTAVLSNNSIATVSDPEVQTGHAWVNHLALAEFRILFNQGRLRIEDRIHFDATQFKSKLTGGTSSRLKEPEYPLAAHAIGAAPTQPRQVAFAGAGVRGL